MASSSSRSKRWILPAVVVLLWLVVGGPLGSFAGKLASVQENDNAAFLPKSAESTIAQEKYTSFVGNESVPTIVVFERDGGLTPEDQKAIAGYADELKKVDNVDANGVVGPLPSGDGTAAQLVVPLAGSDGDEIQQTIVDIRKVLSDAPEGLTALVGGPGGILGDFIEAFGAIDGILLGVALLVGLSRRSRTDSGLGGNGHPRPAVPAALGSVELEGSRAGRRARDRRCRVRGAHVAAGRTDAPGSHRVLADDAEVRLGAPGHPRHLGEGVAPGRPPRPHGVGGHVPAARGVRRVRARGPTGRGASHRHRRSSTGTRSCWSPWTRTRTRCAPRTRCASCAPTWTGSARTS